MTFKQYIDKNWNYDGQSAKTIYFTIKGELIECNYPHDPDDLCRCLQVLRKLYGWDYDNHVFALEIVANKLNSKEYKALAENYKELMSIFETEWNQSMASETYNFMKKIYAQVMGLK